MPSPTSSSTSPDGAAAPSAPKKSPGGLGVARALGVALLVCVLLGGLGYVVTVTMKKQPLRAGDTAALVTAEDLFAATGRDTKPDPAKIKQSRQNLFGSGVEVSYEYESDEPPLYVNTVITISSSAGDARRDYVAQSVGGMVGLAIAGEGVKLEDRDDLFKWGELSKHKRLLLNGEPVGHFFIAIKGKRVFSTIFSGVLFEDGASLRALILPRLEAMEKLPP
jgi:hypothetical protein